MKIFKCRMERNRLYRYCDHCEEFVAARTFLRHKETYYDEHTRIWSKDSGPVLSTSEEDDINFEDDDHVMQSNSGSYG